MNIVKRTIRVRQYIIVKILEGWNLRNSETKKVQQVNRSSRNSKIKKHIKFWLWNLKGKIQSGDVGKEGRNFIFKKWSCNWIQLAHNTSSSGILRIWSQIFASHNREGIS
jgi:hypothetical protein